MHFRQVKQNKWLNFIYLTQERSDANCQEDLPTLPIQVLAEALYKAAGHMIISPFFNLLHVNRG
jgi:hypothetical protein